MVKEFILKFLNRKLDQKKHEYIRMQWQKAELERKLSALKRG